MKNGDKMKVLLLQLPIPQLNYGRQTGNIPLGAACLARAAAGIFHAEVEILPESIVSYLGDAALIDLIVSKKPDLLGFTVFSWNIERSLFMAGEIKKRLEVRTVFGGPEVTRDNPLLKNADVDISIYGEGEAAFIQLLQGAFKEDPAHDMPGGSAEIFRSSRSPYMYNLLEPHIEDMMLLETLRGCPYKCGYCYYNKARDRVVAVPERIVLEGVRWAHDRGLSEVFLLDPSLNARPGLREFVRKIGEINKDGRMRFNSEIRAEGIDLSLAESMARAGFSEFEIGLQSTNPSALKAMNRPTDLARFKEGIENLKKVGIEPKVDLIIGLPGDDLEGFKRSVDFVAENGMYDDVQVFFLSVLPGTDFRKRRDELGLISQARPPYTVLETSSFDKNDLLSAFSYAEEVFDVALESEPDMELSHRSADTDIDRVYAEIAPSPAGPYISKIVFEKEIPLFTVREAARRLTHPYQVIFKPSLTRTAFMKEVLAILSQENPHTPLEIVYMEPGAVFDAEPFDNALKLHRPLYLDRHLPALGDRSVIHTLVSKERNHRFGGILKRQVFLWQENRTPQAADLEELCQLDGILLDSALPRSVWEAWQDEYASLHNELPLVSFSDVHLQQRWTKRVSPGEYYFFK